MALGCGFVDAQTLQVSLAPSEYHGYAISCFGHKDGAIDATVTGGTEPYGFVWSTGADTEDVSGLASGFYRVRVTDALGEEAEAELTLVEPEAMRLSATLFKYPSGFNISCHDCFNGSIDLTVLGGVAPFSYAWEDGAATQDRTAVGAKAYNVMVTDANGCYSRSENYLLTQPERNDWTMGGNSGTNPALHFIGTSDAKDMVFRTNGSERVRLLASGQMRVNGLSGQASGGLLFVDSTGVLKRLTGPGDPAPENESGCGTYRGPTPWYLCGNHIAFDEFLGTINPRALVFKTHDQQRMIITHDGQVGIGTHPAPTNLSSYRLFVEGGIATRDVQVKAGAWPDHVFSQGYRLMPLPELRDYLRSNSHLPGIPSAAEVQAKGGVEVGDLQRCLLETVEQQALYILQLEERIGRMEQRLVILETSK